MNLQVISGGKDTNSKAGEVISEVIIGANGKPVDMEELQKKTVWFWHNIIEVMVRGVPKGDAPKMLGISDELLNKLNGDPRQLNVKEVTYILTVVPNVLTIREIERQMDLELEELGEFFGIDVEILEKLDEQPLELEQDEIDTISTKVETYRQWVIKEAKKFLGENEEEWETDDDEFDDE